MIDYEAYSYEEFSPYRLRMKLKHLELKDFRGFNHLSIGFDKKLTVLIADNGAGKSTILDAVAEFFKFIVDVGIIYSGDKERQLFYEKELSDLSAKDVNNSSESASLAEIFMEVAYPVEIEIIEKNEEGHEKIDIEYEIEQGIIHIQFDLNKKTGNVLYRIVEDEDSNMLTIDDKEFETAFFDNMKLAASSFTKGDAVPVLAYYGGSSIKKNKTENSKQSTSITRLEKIYSQSLKKERFDFNQFYDFYSNHLLMDLQQNKESLSIKSIAAAIEKALNDKDEEQTNYQNFGIDYSNYGGEMGIEKRFNPGPDYVRISIQQLSAGERNLLAIVADLAMRLVIANYENTQIDNPLQGEGIVLIDEIDLHLHPKWQRTVIPKLLDIFPNVQFVVTTHSPLLLQNTPRGKVLTISEGSITKDESNFGGWKIGEILQYMNLKESQLKTETYIDQWNNFHSAYMAGDQDKAQKAFNKIKQMRPSNDSIVASLQIQLDSLNDTII